MKHLDDEISRTISSLDAIDRAHPTGDFKNQVFARWESEQADDRWSRFLRIGIAAMILMCLANVLLLLSTEAQSETDDFSATIVEHFMDTSDLYESNYE